jgi:hypothetical protein
MNIVLRKLCENCFFSPTLLHSVRPVCVSAISDSPPLTRLGRLSRASTEGAQGGRARGGGRRRARARRGRAARDGQDAGAAAAAPHDERRRWRCGGGGGWSGSVRWTSGQRRSCGGGCQGVRNVRLRGFRGEPVQAGQVQQLLSRALRSGFEFTAFNCLAMQQCDHE